MRIRNAFASCFAVALLATLPAAHAGEKKISFKLQNKTGASLELKIGDKPAMLKNGEILPLKLPIGTRIVTETATEHHPAGELIAVVSGSMYRDSTISIGN